MDLRSAPSSPPCLALLFALALLALARCANGERPQQDPPALASAETAYAEAVSALQNGNGDAARSALRRAAGLAAGNVETLLRVAIAQARADDVPGSIETYEALLRVDPRHAQALHNLGNAYFRQNRYPEAETYYRRAVEADPDYLLALYHHGWVLRQLDRPAEARPPLEHCLDLPAPSQRDRTTQLDCRFLLGTLRFREGDLAGAVALLEPVVADAPAHLEARYYLGTALTRLGRSEEGARHLDAHRELLRARRRNEPIEKPQEP